MSEIGKKPGFSGASRLSLSDNTTVGMTEINAKNPGVLIKYYVEAVGLEEISTSSTSSVLGKNNQAIVTIRKHDQHGTKLVNTREPGLYHSAILFDNKAELATTLLRMAEHGAESFTGAADHLVSEAFYFTDPEGNGLELYTDRPRSEWSWQNGRVQMATLPLNVNKFITDNRSNELVESARMGHIHLKLGDVALGKKFYADMLGFDIVSEFPGAVFYSAGGYHHHIGTNNWGINPAAKRDEQIGLSFVTLKLDSRHDFEGVISSLESNQHAYQRINDTSISVIDYWGNSLKLEF